MRLILCALTLLTVAGCNAVYPWTRPAPVGAMPGPNAAGSVQPIYDPGNRPMR